MSPRKKTSRAVIKSARFNPVTSEKDMKALEIIEELEGKGYNFHQIAVDAILTRGGATPEMFDPENGTRNMISQLETMLADFSADLMRNLKGRRDFDIDDDDEGRVSQFTANFAKGFLARQQQVLGDDEE